ncbi:MAG: thioredoxin domain-containing protein [Acidobacteriota bacterium]|nr:thioredoxin domain-containing protein [Acidobacteriota bacterium]
MDSQATKKEAGIPNRLIGEKSPYLLQHAYNPVDWRPWSPEAFEAARREDKPVFLSIGYSTCHWCHVMERESFEDAEVAAQMNKAFIPVKVDREERPDIDNIYMRICQMLTGSGGWPLTIVMTPEKKPFFAGTYIPKGERFGQMGMLSLIPRIHELWTERRADVEKSSEEIMGAFMRSDRLPAGPALGPSTLDSAFEEMAERFDEENGGFGRAPKFPTPHALIFLLRYGHRTGDAHALEMAERTLAAMRRGGIYDHVGFGFHRYSTDAGWLVPHFEKMLYDQALLLAAYSEAFEATRNEDYARTAHEIIDYVERQMTSPEGGFYSAEDADSERREGKFYLWRESEVRAALSPTEASLVAVAFNLDPEGNFSEQGTSGPDGANILYLAAPPEQIAARIGISSGELEERWQAARQKLFLKREERVHPLKDDKILTDWNGLMIAGLGRASQALGDPRPAAIAQRASDFIFSRLKSSEGALLHRFRGGEAAGEAHLDDYAFLIWGLIELYEAAFEARNLHAALQLMDYAVDHFWDEQRGGFYFTGDHQEQVLMRGKETYDGAVPSGNAAAMLDLLRLSHLTGRTDYADRAAKMAEVFAGTVRQGPSAYTHWLTALDFALGPTLEVVISGDPAAEDTKAMMKALRAQYAPRKVVILRPAGANEDLIARIAPYTREQTPVNGQSTAYICQNFSCSLPTTDVGQMLSALKLH